MLEDIYAQLWSMEVNPWNAAFRLLLSMLLGSAVGFERKRKGQLAGLRTFALISMGSTLAMLISIYVPQEFLGLKNGDPGRIAAQVITGIGFLGAGAIIRMRGSVRGLTTAAGIWVVATIGMAVGVGMYAEAVIATLAIFFVLMALSNIENMVHMGAEPRAVKIKIEGTLKSLEPYKKAIGNNRARLTDYFVDYDFNSHTTRLNLFILIKEDTDVLRFVRELSAVGPTLSISFGSEISS